MSLNASTISYKNSPKRFKRKWIDDKKAKKLKFYSFLHVTFKFLYLYFPMGKFNIYRNPLLKIKRMKKKKKLMFYLIEL